MSAHDVVEIPGLHRKDERPLPRWLVVAICALAALAVAAGLFLMLRTGEVQDQADQLPVVAGQRDRAVDVAADLGRQVVAACARGEVVQSPDGQNLCARAAQVQADPVPGVPIPGERGPGPTVEQIRSAVEQYMTANPPPRGEAGRPPTPDEVAAAVAQYMTANPPQSGRPPTAAEIADAVATYFATNPPPEGPSGPRGERGPGPTAEEIQRAVDAYLAENPPPAGPAGPTCAEGSELEVVRFGDGRFGLGCVLTDQPDPEPTDEPAPTTTTAPPDDVESEPGP